jgi:hypothetical protein
VAKKKKVVHSLSRDWQPEPEHNGHPITRYFLQPDAEIEPQGIVVSQKDGVIYVKMVSPDGRLVQRVRKGSGDSTIISFHLDKPSPRPRLRKRNARTAAPIIRKTPPKVAKIKVVKRKKMIKGVEK